MFRVHTHIHRMRANSNANTPTLPENALCVSAAEFEDGVCEDLEHVWNYEIWRSLVLQGHNLIQTRPKHRRMT